MTEAWALIDPNWGDPVPVLETIRATEVEASEAAITAESVKIYSGAALHCTPIQKGSMWSLHRHGFRVARVMVVRLHDGGTVKSITSLVGEIPSEQSRKI